MNQPTDITSITSGGLFTRPALHAPLAKLIVSASVIGDEALILFPSKALLFGYYIAWFGALLAVIGEASLVMRLTRRVRSDDSANNAASD